jgi:hypothetical protein
LRDACSREKTLRNSWELIELSFSYAGMIM